jgi:uncharacterized protein (UPF0332 family)
MNAEDFIAFAENVLPAQPQGAACRSVISRAYYGAFHLANSLLADQGITTDHNHGHLQHDFLYSANALSCEIGVLLQELHSTRVEADYRLRNRRTENPSLANETLESAKRVLVNTTQLRRMFHDPAVRQAFIDAVAAYRKKVNRRL